MRGQRFAAALVIVTRRVVTDVTHAPQAIVRPWSSCALCLNRFARCRRSLVLRTGGSLRPLFRFASLLSVLPDPERHVSAGGTRPDFSCVSSQSSTANPRTSRDTRALVQVITVKLGDARSTPRPGPGADFLRAFEGRELGFFARTFFADLFAALSFASRRRRHMTS